MYGLVGIAGGGFLGVTAMVISILEMGGGRSLALAICMALSSVALFLSGTIFYVASCCPSQASEGEKPKAKKSK
jgi:hypothetical protein